MKEAFYIQAVMPRLSFRNNELLSLVMEFFTGRNEVVAKVMFFTGVCLSTGGEGVCLSACWDARPGRHPPDQADTLPTRQTPR